VLPSALLRKDTRRLAGEFLWWRMKKGLGVAGRILRSLVQMKQTLQRLLCGTSRATAAN
jgi:hypothetical protein